MQSIWPPALCRSPYPCTTVSRTTAEQKIKKSNLHHTRGITSKRVTSGGAYLRGLAPEQHSSEKTSQRWRAFGDTVSDSTDLRLEPTPENKSCLL